MRGNVEKVLERDQKLSQLDDRADALQQGARYHLVFSLLRYFFADSIRACIAYLKRV